MPRSPKILFAVLTLVAAPAVFTNAFSVLALRAMSDEAALAKRWAQD
jgi:hypothetical protein